MIDRKSPLPLYYQLKRVLLAKIDSSELKPGDIFPTEQQIQETYQVSRTTVRQALSELEDEGKITRHRGRGTFVTKPKVSHSAEQYPNLADNMSKQGLTPGWKVLLADWVAADSAITTRLKLPSVQKVFCLERLRLENDEAIGHHMAYVSPAYASAIDEASFTEGGSLRYLRHLTVLANCIANRTLEAIEANPKIAVYLNVEVGAALLRVRRIVYTPDDSPVELFEGVYRGDRFEYHINHMRAVSNINA
ncbi:MAG: GntR family transcriptional regulator [Anaerolineae bacterium]|nr:GntR family transcriptional regulator [Anaerolineae bacterium]